MPTLVPPLPPLAASGDLGPIATAVSRDLERWGKADDAAGALLLLIARRLDSSERESGSGVAALSKVFTTFWADLAATAERDDQDSPLTRFRRQRGSRLPAETPWNPAEDPA